MFQRPPAAVPGEKNLTVMLWLVATGFFMQTLDATIVNTALPSMAASLGESPLRMQSVVIAYSLTMAVMIPVWLARRYLRHAACVLQCDPGVLARLAAVRECAYAHATCRVPRRAGVGGAMLLPVGRLAVLRTFPAERYLAALSFVAIPA